MRIWSVSLLLALLGGAAVDAAERVDERFFEMRIRPLLAEHCFECHQGDEVHGGLRLDRSASVLAGGDSGPAISPGDPDDSLLLGAVRYEGLEMPPEGQLPEEAIADLERWIKAGAPWPADPDGDAPASGSGEGADGTWWAAEPLEAGPLPGAGGRSRIDAYVRARLDEQGLAPAPEADRATLIRRLSFDLLGVPPEPEAIDAFVRDARPGAYRRLVDSMLASPEYGERWGRHWLDLVRYAESDGWRQDAFRPNAWRYRDWVIRALNADMPYDEFVSLQLAGDEIDPEDPDALAAVGFLRQGIYEYNQRDAEGQWEHIVDEMTDVTADVFLATGMACAKCHDHKFDPIPRADYFRLRSVFEPVVWRDVEIARHPEKPVRVVSRDGAPGGGALEDSEAERLQEELDALERPTREKIEREVVDKFPLEVQAMYRKPAEQRTSYEEQIAYLVYRQVLAEEGKVDARVKKALDEDQRERREEILARLEQLRSAVETVTVMAVRDAPGPTRPTRLPGRTQGREFEPGVPEVFGGDRLEADAPSSAPESTGRRFALARWITHPENPITARVAANRLWQHHFGAGLVTTENDFGRLGEPPSHPRLLDYLATELMRDRWSLKSLHREIVLSDVYRQSSVHPDADAALRVDAANRLLWHYPVRRLDAEQFRDALLVTAGRLDRRFGGPSPSGAPARRTVYLRRMRNSPDEMLQLLDAPSGLSSTARRAVTITAPQSLMLLNSPRTINVAGSFAKRVRAEVEDGDPQRFARRAYRIATGQEPPEPLLRELAEAAAGGSSGQADLCHALINSNAFLFIE